MESTDFTDTLDSLGTFFGQVGTAVAGTYSAVNKPTIPTTVRPASGATLPAQSFGTQASTFFSGGFGQLVVLILIGFGLVFGVRALSKK